ncbi:MAG: patatin-like phospholipase family protein [Alphaproteobacteria bacterium]|nr:patatin-like phospholipase family protein [Alphaproteobacteria bacterium]
MTEKKTKTNGAEQGLKPVAIALQGGGSHGAFSWGVMDRLLEDGRFKIEGLTGTSAGGMNAVAVAQGLMKGGNQQAREELRNFWQEISNVGKHSSLNNRGPVDKMMGKYTMYNSPGFMIFDLLSRMFSPYELNPSGHDPLKETIEKCFDFDKLRKYKDCKVYLCATHVFSGRLKVFSLDEMRVECLLATACLPTIHNAIKVDGEYYWDGGFIGNPVFFPLIYNCETPDIIMIQLNPTVRNTLPTTSRQIGDRLNEITNNASVVREMRAISFISDLIDQGLLDKNKVKRVHMHVIEDEEVFQELGWSSKLNTEWEFLTHLFEKGRRAADKWIKENYDNVGKKTTAPMKEHFVGDTTASKHIHKHI